MGIVLPTGVASNPKIYRIKDYWILTPQIVCAIYDLRKSGGTNFLVLELVEGERLADQQKRGSIPIGESGSVQSRTI